MVNTLAWVGVICIVLVGAGYYTYTQQNTLVPTVQKYVPSSFSQVFPTGDIASLNLNAPGMTHNTYVYTAPVTGNATQVAQTTQNNTLRIGNNTNATLKPDVSTISTVQGQTYGQTNLMNTPLPADTVKLGAPVDVSGQLKLVIPDSCKLINGQTTCDYVSPPIFKGLIEITCKIPENDNCAMDTNDHWFTTDGLGDFAYEWETNTGGINPGAYLITLQANSLTNQTSGVPFPIQLSKLVYLVN